MNNTPRFPVRDVEKFSNTLRYPGFDVLALVSGAQGPDVEFRAFAISDSGYASELLYQETIQRWVSLTSSGPKQPAAERCARGLKVARLE